MTADLQAPTAPAPRTFKYYDLLMAAFVTVLICANLIGAGKVATIAGFTLGACRVIIPLS
jgi:hypothetical protein